MLTEPEEQWWAAVELGARGRYGDAWAVLEPLAAGEGRVASLAASTLGSHHRQLGRHAAGREWDERALQLADDAESRAEAQLGLAADAVGLNELGTARAHLEQARATLDPEPPRTTTPRAPTPALRGAGDLWRVRVRVDWVRAEVALLAGDVAGAAVPARAAVARAEAAGSERHVAKSLLFVAVAVLGDEGDEALRRAWRLSEQNGWLTLVWPAALLAARLGDEEEARMRAAGGRAVHSISERLPEDIARGWVAGADLRRLPGREVRISSHRADGGE